MLKSLSDFFYWIELLLLSNINSSDYEYDKDVDKFLTCIMNRGEVIAWNYYSVIINLNNIDYKLKCYYLLDYKNRKFDRHSFTECSEIQFDCHCYQYKEPLLIYKNKRPSAKVLIRFSNWICKNSNITKDNKNLLNVYTFNDDIQLERNELKKIIGE